MNKAFYSLVISVLLPPVGNAQNPLTHWTEAVEARYSNKQPVVHYVLSVDSSDLSSIKMEMQISNIPDTFDVAMIAHPEYDDMYWRYIRDIHVVSKSKHPGTTDIQGIVLRKDSALWQVITKGNKAILNYRIQLPNVAGTFRSSWKAFLSSNGGLVGGPHCFMYVVGATLAPSYVTLSIPSSWQVITGLSLTSDPHTFFSPSVNILVDDPILIGNIRRWTFKVDDVPHTVAYWPSSAKDFDTTALLSGVKKLVEQTSLLFGRLPYREYFFMLQDSAYGSLEHNNSVTTGAPVRELTSNMKGVLSEIAHEYFHSWNLMRIRPIEYGDVSYRTPPLSKGLWFSEGLTMFYADLLKRRAGLPVSDSTRLKHLEALIRRYSNSPAYTKFSAETISLASYGPTGMLGDYQASTHLHGEVIGAMLDLIIRDASNGTRSIDDVMRKMMEKFSGKIGFTSKDIGKVTSEVCGCNLSRFFQDYIFGNKHLDFDKYLRLLGLESNISWNDVRTDDGKPAPDLRIYSWVAPIESDVRVGITNPASCWGKAGLHTGDKIISVNGSTIGTTADFRQVIRAAKIGDTIVIEVNRPTGTWKVPVIISGYQQPVVQITLLKDATEKQRKLFAQWESGN